MVDMNYQQKFDQRPFFFAMHQFVCEGHGHTRHQKVAPVQTNLVVIVVAFATHTKWNEGSKYPISSLGKLRYESIHSTDYFREVSLVAQWKAAGNNLD